MDQYIIDRLLEAVAGINITAEMTGGSRIDAVKFVQNISDCQISDPEDVQEPAIRMIRVDDSWFGDPVVLNSAGEANEILRDGEPYDPNVRVDIHMWMLEEAPRNPVTEAISNGLSLCYVTDKAILYRDTNGNQQVFPTK